MTDWIEAGLGFMGGILIMWGLFQVYSGLLRPVVRPPSFSAKLYRALQRDRMRSYERNDDD